MQESPRQPQVLVVDDDPDTASILLRHLAREGFDALEAKSGAECLGLVQHRHIDAILLDLMLPDMNGFQICRALKSDPTSAGIPIIVVSARDDDEARAELISLGITDFLSKPISREQLGNRLRLSLGKHSVVCTPDPISAAVDRRLKKHRTKP